MIADSQKFLRCELESLKSQLQAQTKVNPVARTFWSQAPLPPGCPLRFSPPVSLHPPRPLSSSTIQ